MKVPTPLWAPGLLLPLGLGSIAIAASNQADPIQPASNTQAAEGMVGTGRSLFFGDVDGDGLQDVASIDAAGGLRLLLNFGQGRYEDITAASGLSEIAGASCALFSDLNGDGRDDLFLGSSEQRVWQNLGNAVFQPFDSGIDHDLVDLAAGVLDLDQDGRSDLRLLTERGDVIYRNLGEGRFERVGLPLQAAGTPMVEWAPVAQGAPESGVQPTALIPKAAAELRLNRWSQAFSSAARIPGSTSAAAAGPPSLGGLNGELACFPLIKDSSGPDCLAASSAPTLGQLYPLSEDFFVDANGNVGFGTTSPSKNLVLSDIGDASILIAADTNNDNNSDHAGLRLTQDAGNTDGYFGFAAGENDLKIVTDTSGSSNPGDIVLLAGGPAGPDASHLRIEHGTGLVSVSNSMTLSTDEGDIALTISADTDNDNEGDHAGIRLTQDGGITDAYIGYTAGENDLKIVTDTSGSDNYGDIVLLAGGPAGPGASHLRIENGTGLVSVAESLEIRGGADIVEGFNSSCGELEPGTVVIIDPANPGQLTCSFEAYDTKVAGVVSGAGGVNPGLHLGQDGVLDGDTPVAMTGRVYVHCSAENGAIQPGDRLTTAGLSGHAMKVADNARSIGAVIGKAMSSLEEGSGLVLVLVNLQ